MNLKIETAAQFRDQFVRMGRGKQFSYDALGVLFDHLESLDPEYSLDVIELCCNYHEINWEEARQEHTDLPDGANIDAIRDSLQEQGLYVGETKDTVILYNC